MTGTPPPSSLAQPRLDRIGPGHLVLVVGPSGAGKDTLIGGARAACAGDNRVVFPRRAITRPSSKAEDNETVSAHNFDRIAAFGAFALSWDAHGHRYGIPSAINDDICSGRTVVCNVSRTVTAVARQRYSMITVVQVTAPPEILEKRLAVRGRPSDGSLADRLSRSSAMEAHVDADVVICNVGDPEVGVKLLLKVIRKSAGLK